MSTFKKYDARDTTLDSIIFSNCMYQVPRYQRPYSWGVEELSLFWEDISGGEADFMGSFIFNAEAREQSDRLDVVDGQQRLLTLTILCAVIRDVAQTLCTELAATCQRTDLAIEHRLRGLVFRLKAADSIQDYFQRHIQEQGNPPVCNPKVNTSEEETVAVAYNFLLEGVRRSIAHLPSDEEKVDRLNWLRKRLGAYQVVRIVVNSEDDAYEVFESTNARGLELSVADLLKNLVLRKLRAAGGGDDAKEVWADIVSEIEATETELRKFVRYYWASRHAPVGEKQLFSTIKGEVKDWSGFLSDLSSSSGDYRKLLRPQPEDFAELKHSDRIVGALEALREMRVSQCYVLFMSILRNYSRLGSDPVRVFEFIERFTFQYSVVCKLPGNRIERVFSKHALKLERAVASGQSKKVTKEVDRIFNSLMQELREVAPSKQTFMEAFEDVSYKNSTEARRLVGYILAKYDSHFSTTKEYRIDFGSVNIEHLLPTKPDKSWGLTQREIRPYVNKLGNLTLLDLKVNSTVQNATIDKKLPDLKKSRLALVERLVAHFQQHGTTWGETQIRERHRELAELAYDKIWRI